MRLQGQRPVHVTISLPPPLVPVYVCSNALTPVNYMQVSDHVTIFETEKARRAAGLDVGAAYVPLVRIFIFLWSGNSV